MTPDETLPPAPASPSSIPEVALVLELGRTLQECGVSAPTLENALARLAQHLDLEGAVYATPTGFLASLRKEGLPGKTYLIRADAGDSRLERLAEAEGLVDLVLQDRLDVATARRRLGELAARPGRYPAPGVISAYGLASLGMAVIFGGGWREAVLGTLVGLLVGAAAWAAGRRRASARLLPVLGGVISSLGGALLGRLLPSASHPILVISGIIVLVPGLGLLVSMQELGTGNLVAGTARLAGTFLVFLLLAFGVGLGQRLGGAWLVGAFQPPAPLPSWTYVPALALAALGFLVVFQSRPRDYPWTLGACILAWGIAALGTRALGPEAGAGLAALALGAACNQYARRTRRPAAVLQLPALMLILPGSLGVKGLSLMLQGRTLDGLQAGFGALTVTVALMLGLFLANALVPRRSF